MSYNPQHPQPQGQYQQPAWQAPGQGQGGQQQQYQQHPGQPPHQQQQQYQAQPGYQQQQHMSSQGYHQAAGVVGAGESGNLEGIQYSITHRDTNTLLTVNLQQGAALKAKPGAMIHMSTSVQMKGNVKFSFKKMVTGGEMSESMYYGPGELALAPSVFGDVIAVQVRPGEEWNVGRDAFLAATQNVTKDTKSQGFGKSLFSGEGMFISKIRGQGMVWLSSFGAITKKDLRQGEQHIVDNGHLVAWNCQYSIEQSGSLKDSLVSGEGRVCRFVGPGTVYIQTRNPQEFASWARAMMGIQ